MQIAKAYLYRTDNGISTRTWQQALDALTAGKKADNQERWKRGGKEKPFDLKSEYFDCLAKYEVTHVYNSWEAMPPVSPVPIDFAPDARQ